ncbi:hypothetical protein BH11BAC1_BH11BAC1_14510 [soil metagenome]
MKKILFVIAFCLVQSFGFSQTAVDFTANDCDGTSHNLFSELNSGKVIVLCMVMPCGACTGPALTSLNVVQSYMASHPHTVYLYISDDFANTTCTSLDTWRNNNGLTAATSFSDASISMADYGGNGMPKIVVLGGGNHTVFYTANDVVDAVALQDAIDDAISVAGISEQNKLMASLSISPNPATEKAELKYNLLENTNLQIQLYSLQGKLVRELFNGKCTKGENMLEVNTQLLAAGSYLIKVSDGSKRNFINLVVTR